MELDTIYMEYKQLLVSIAYRMLGTKNDAEDIVQDTFVALQSIELGEIRNLKAYLVKGVTNRCLNYLKSNRHQREVYTGPWLPEPDIEVNDSMQNPEEKVVMEESVSYALLVMLQQLSPMERAIFLLREVLDYDYAQIAETLDKSEAGCRKILSRLKSKMSSDRTMASEPDRSTAPFVQSFLQAARTGNFEPFVHMLVEQATLISDGGGKVRAAIFPIMGKLRIQSFLEGIYAKGAFSGELQHVQVNGDSGLLLQREGEAKFVICFGTAPESGAIQSIYIINNPDKLLHISTL